MSIISDRHLFVEFESGKSKPFDGQRLAKVGYKAKSGKKSQCVSIPKLSDGDVEVIHAAFPLDIRKRVEDFQDGLIRALLESGKTEITSSEISAEQIRAFVEATSESNRLSGEVVSAWWKDTFADVALPVLSEKYGTDDAKILEQKSAAWRDAFVALCGRSAITRERITNLQGMLEFADEDDAIALRLNEKLATLVRELETMDAL